MVPSRTENIACLVQRPKTPIVKPPMHRSMYSRSVKKAYDAAKDCHRTMGYSEIRIDPGQFLKKHTRKVIKPFVDKTGGHRVPTPIECAKRMAAQKKYTYGTVERTEPVKKNFVLNNKINAIRSVPPLPKHRTQITRHGHVIDLDKAGLEPVYVLKKCYGKIPKYLKMKLAADKAAKQAEEERIRSIKRPQRLLPKEERDELLKGLKTNWIKMHEQYLLLPVMTDTLSKQKRKLKMEKDLSQLEADIAMLNRYEVTYVPQDY